MCDFFCFTSNGKGKVFYFDAKQRRDANLAKAYSFDSHSSIAAYFLQDPVADDRVNKYEYSSGIFEIDQINVDDDSEQVKAWILQFVKSEEFEDLCVATIPFDVGVLYHVQKQTPEICLAAVKQNEWAIFLLQNKFRDLVKKELNL